MSKTSSIPDSNNRRIRRTEAFWQRVCREFEISNESRASYCKRKKIALGTFAKWRSLISASCDTPALVELVPPSDGSCADVANTHTQWDLELALPGGVTLRMRTLR